MRATNITLKTTTKMLPKSKFQIFEISWVFRRVFEKLGFFENF